MTVREAFERGMETFNAQPQRRILVTNALAQAANFPASTALLSCGWRLTT